MPEIHESQAAPLRDAQGRWQPGQSGNPGGSPERHLKLTTVLRRILQETVGHDSEITRGELLMRAVVEYAQAGNAALVKEILERIDGKVAERIEADLGADWEYVVEPDDAPEAAE